MKKIDKIYQKKKKITPFVFNKETADVFDDMLRRSIPAYSDLQAMIVDFITKFYKKNTVLYDIGCSTGNTIAELYKKSDCLFQIKAVDKSNDMITMAKKKCAKCRGVEWICAGVEDLSFEKASVIIASYVLQFVSPLKRKRVIKKMFKGLGKNGILILSEKVKAENKKIESIINKLYYDFKIKNGYTEQEIIRKEKALKDILITFTLEKYLKILQEVGFTKVQVLFRYLNFVSLIALK
jgi:tRNA (cmo5U34)-methyltransferase